MLISRKQYFCLKRFVIVITSTIRTCLTSAVFNSFTATACNLSLTYLSSNRFPYSLETFRVLFDVFFLDNVIFMKACFSFFFCMRRLGCGKSPLKETTISSIISLATKFLSRRLSFLIEFSEIVNFHSNFVSIWQKNCLMRAPSFSWLQEKKSEEVEFIAIYYVNYFLNLFGSIFGSILWSISLINCLQS